MCNNNIINNVCVYVILMNVNILIILILIMCNNVWM